MPAAVSPNIRPTVEHDDLDDLFNYDPDIQEGQDRNAQTNSNDSNANQPPQDPIGGIDEEVKVTKKRKPVAKLDEDRLLSQAGIPKLRKIARDQLKIKGKGHEFSDMARLLNTYQLWLDDLFPKAKFIDGVSMVEKLGHKKRIQMMRKEWIDEGKPKPPRDEDEDEDDFVIPEADAETSQVDKNPPTVDQRIEGSRLAVPGEHMDHGQGQSPADQAFAANDQREPEDDELDALLAEGATEANARKPGNVEPVTEREPDADELDALLAEDTRPGAVSQSLFGGPVLTESRQSHTDDFADEEEAMAGMEW